MHFTPTHTDFHLSPYTGLTRESWIEAAIYMLEGVFANIKDLSDPCVVPRYETEVTYPNSRSAPWQTQAEYFEGLTRTFFIAAPLIREDERICVQDVCLRDYYAAQVLGAVTKGDSRYVRTYTEMAAEYAGGDKYRAFQQTVETCALVICLDATEGQIWQKYTQEERDQIAAFLQDYAGTATVPQNWRMFNMLVMAFLDKHGYQIDADIMREHAQTILSYYAGDGWYRDGHSFDYYSCWAFQVYGAIWCNWYGYEKEPKMAEKFERNSNDLMKTFDRHFDADGWVNMWGRSCIYRFAAVSPLAENLTLRHPTVNPGLARRIASGALMQFLSREDFLWSPDGGKTGVPTLGFYGTFVPLVQGYSCAESPYWMGKAFLCLLLDADSPFWTVREEGGVWADAGEETAVTVLNGPGICYANHRKNGTTEMRTGKVLKAAGDIHGMWNYAKLVYSTKYPWEASPEEGTESQQYVLYDENRKDFTRCNVTFWHGEKENVLYRQQYFGFTDRAERHWMTCMNLADIAMSEGLLRVDRYRTFQGPFTLMLGSYGVPDDGNAETDIRENQDCVVSGPDGAEEKLRQKAIIIRSRDAMGREKQMAMTILFGWEELDLLHSEHTNPDSEKSMLARAKARHERLYAYDHHLLISQVITRESHEKFTDEELFPVIRLETEDIQRMGNYGAVILNTRDGRKIRVDFDGMEGQESL